MAERNNFHRAWSPPKKQWCCGREGKGCEGSSPPGISAGAGMTLAKGFKRPLSALLEARISYSRLEIDAFRPPRMWKHVQVNGFWTWTAVHSGASATALPYDCHAGLANWKLGWRLES